MLATYIRRMRNNNQVPVVQTLESAIHGINHYPLDSAILVSLILIHWILIYPLHSAIQRLNRHQNSRFFFFSKSVKKSIRAVSLSVFSLVPDLLFDCSRVLEYAKIRTVLQSNVWTTGAWRLGLRAPLVARNYYWLVPWAGGKFSTGKFRPGVTYTACKTTNDREGLKLVSNMCFEEMKHEFPFGTFRPERQD